MTSVTTESDTLADRLGRRLRARVEALAERLQVDADHLCADLDIDPVTVVITEPDPDLLGDVDGEYLSHTRTVVISPTAGATDRDPWPTARAMLLHELAHAVAADAGATDDALHADSFRAAVEQVRLLPTVNLHAASAEPSRAVFWPREPAPPMAVSGLGRPTDRSFQ